MKNRTDVGTAKTMTIVLGALVIIWGIIGFIYDWLYVDYNEYTIFFVVVSSVLRVTLMAAGAYILYTHDRVNVMRDVGFIMLIIGGYELFVFLTLFIPSQLDVQDIVDFVTLGMSILVCLVDVFVVLLSIRFMLGHRRNALRLAVCFAIPIVEFACVILFNIPYFNKGFEYVFGTLGPFISTSVVYIVILIILLLPYVRDEPSEWKVYTLSESKYESFNIDPESSIYRHDLLAFIDEIKEPEKWERSKDIPELRECTLRFGLYKKYLLTMRKSDDVDTIRASILAAGTKEYIQCVRFDFNTIAPRDGTIYTCKMVRIYGFDGFFIELRVRDTIPKPESSLLFERIVDDIGSIVKKFTKPGKS